LHFLTRPMFGLLLGILVSVLALANAPQASADGHLEIPDAPADWIPVLDEAQTVDELASYLLADTSQMSESARQLPASLRSWQGPDEAIVVVWVFEAASAEDASDFVRNAGEAGEPCPSALSGDVVTTCETSEFEQTSAAWRSGSTAAIVVTSPIDADVLEEFVSRQLASHPTDVLVGAGSSFGPLAIAGVVVILVGLAGLIWWFQRQSSGRERDESGADDTGSTVLANDGQVDLGDA
jgi:hypothetical protein